MPSRVKNSSQRVTLAYTTVEKKTDALRIAQLLVREQLAACVTIVSGVTSVYPWKGTTVTAREYLLTIKTRTGLVSRLGKRIREISPYELPEFIAVEHTRGNSDYVEWVYSNTKP